MMGKEWTKEQKEVWGAVEALSDLWVNGDLEGLTELSHPDYSSWHYGNPLPRGWVSIEPLGKHWHEANEVVLRVFSPAKISVFDNVALVHYYMTTVTRKKAEGSEEERVKTRYTDIFMKKGGRWLIVGDHGGGSLIEDAADGREKGKVTGPDASRRLDVARVGAAGYCHRPARRLVS